QEHLLTAEERKLVFEWESKATELRLRYREAERLVRLATGHGRSDDRLLNIANHISPSYHVGIYRVGSRIEGIGDAQYFVILMGSTVQCDEKNFDNCKHTEKLLAKDFETAVEMIKPHLPV